MASTQQSQAIANANILISLAGQLLSIYNTMVVLDGSWTDQSTATVLAALQTVALNADGSLGAPDASPNSAHPINAPSFPPLARALSSTQITQIKTILDGIVSYVGGTAVTTQPSARPILNAAVGG